MLSISKHIVWTPYYLKSSWQGEVVTLDKVARLRVILADDWRALFGDRRLLTTVPTSLLEKTLVSLEPNLNSFSSLKSKTKDRLSLNPSIYTPDNATGYWRGVDIGGYWEGYLRHPS